MNLLRIFLPLVFAFLFLANSSCGGVDPEFNRFVKNRYPNCDVVKIKEVGNHKKVVLQCGVQLKTVKFRDIR